MGPHKGTAMSTYEVVTSMSESYYDKIGSVMLESFLDRWPEDIKLRIYTEDDLCLQASPRYKVYDLYESERAAQEFVARNKNRPDQQNPKELHMGAVRFSYKTFSIINACMSTNADYMIWLDADTFTHTDITHEFLDSLVDDSKYLTYLGRDNNYSECGFVIYNINHRVNQNFMVSWKKLYTSDTVFELDQWHDSFVFDTLRKSFEQFQGIQNNNLSPWGKNYDHVFINSVLGEYMDHMKGNRKDFGKSRRDDITRERKSEYWSNI